jgi:predicted lipoprotein with Yx(FWY)xxD motif
MNLKIVFSALGLVAIMAACAGTNPTASPGASSTPGATPASATPGATPASTTPASSATPAGSEDAGSAVVELAESDLGSILVDAEGNTLYAFLPDEAADGEPTCYDQCADNWPALLAEGEVSVGEGLDDSMFSTVERTDGGTQVRVNEYPLYTFVNDEAPGDTNGQGINEVWFVVGDDGEPIGAPEE